MKKALLMTFAVLTALSLGLGAQEISFDTVMSNLPSPAAAVPSVGEPAIVDAQPRAATAAPAQREWLVLVFINGVNDLGILGYANKSVNEMEKVGSTARMAVVVEYGILGIDDPSGRNLRFERGSKTIYVTKDADPARITSVPFYSSKDSDMGSAANLVRFVKRGLRKFPARKVAVVVWNHGGGLLGISNDDVSQNHMEVPELGQALGQIKQALGHKIDLFATDACLMQMAAVAYEMKDSADVIVGSEETVPGDSYPYDKILGTLADHPGMNAESLGALMVSAYGDKYANDATLSALRASALPGLTAALNNWVGAVRSDPAAFKAASSRELTGETSHFARDYSKDLYDYMDRVNKKLPPGSGAAKAAGSAVKNYLTTRLVIRNVMKPADEEAYTAAHGLAIYLPELRYNSANYEKMAFARDSLWDDFLRDLMEERLKP